MQTNEIPTIDVNVDIAQLLTDACTGNLRGGTKVDKKTYQITDADAYVSYDGKDGATAHDTKLFVPTSSIVQFVANPGNFPSKDGPIVKFDYFNDPALTKDDKNVPENIDQYITSSEHNTEANITMCIHCQGDDGRPWSISWDPTIIVVDPAAIDVNVQVAQLLSDVSSGNLRPGAKVDKQTHTITSADEYVSYDGRNGATTEGTTLSVPTSRVVQFVAHPAHYPSDNGPIVKFDYFEDNALTKYDKNVPANIDQFISAGTTSTQSGITMQIHCQDDNGRVWTISWDPTIIVVDPATYLL